MASEAWQAQLAKQAMHAMQGMQAKLTGAVGTRLNPREPTPSGIRGRLLPT